MKKFLALALTMMLLLGLVACGGNTTSTPATSSPAASAPASEAASTPAATGSKIEQIQAAGKLVMMTNAEFPPFEYLSFNEPAGVDIELAQMVADELGVELEVLNMDFDALVGALQSGKGDIVAAGMSITEERLQQVDFSIPYVDSTLLIIVPVGSSYTGPDDLTGLTIAVQEGTTSDLFATDYVEGATILRFKGAVEAGNAVKSGKADVAVIDQLTAQNVVNASPDELMLLDEPLSQEQYAMAVGKGGEDLLALVNEVLGKAVEEGKVDELIATHMELSIE